jgi:hypothetical protein
MTDEDTADVIQAVRDVVETHRPAAACFQKGVSSVAISAKP